MLILDELGYSEEHVWVRQEDEGTVTVGITDFAQSALGDLIYVELPNEGDEIIFSEPFGSVECADLVSELYAPIGGRVLDVNRDIIDDPGIISDAPYGRGWLLRIQLSDMEELGTLLSADDYEDYILTSS